jgi:hypothetical protein
MTNPMINNAAEERNCWLDTMGIETKIIIIQIKPTPSPPPYKTLTEH